VILTLEALSEIYEEEERLVAELELLGIRYLSRHTSDQAQSVRPPDVLLADLVRQPSARVRAAVIAVLLAHPEYADAVPAAMKRLRPAEQLTLRTFYTAALLLQQEYAERLRSFVGSRPLPDRFAADLGLPDIASPRERLATLARRHRQETQADVNWIGTYESVVRRLLRSWELGNLFEHILPKAAEADIVPQEFRSYFEELRRRVVKRERGLSSRLRDRWKDVG
jgi:hypothetical protein